MTPNDPTPDRRRYEALILAALLIGSALVRLRDFGMPLTDQLNSKQVFAANKARNIARPPYDLRGHRLDFLGPDGRPMDLAEEIPLFFGLLGLAYRAFGEHEWLGRLINIGASLAAIAALYDLLRREADRRVAFVAALLFSCSPLLLFYGRAPIPDVGMLAGMLVAAACYRRGLDGGSRRWLAGAALAGIAAAAFKYYGLLAMVPILDMERRRGGWRACVSARVVAVGAAMVLPIASWIVLVFARSTNPASEGAYFLFQDPGFLLSPRLYERLFLGLGLRDCGPVLGGLAAVGAWAILRGRVAPGPLAGWAVTGLGFLALFAPKFRDHDYYGLMVLPAASLLGALGWRAIAGSGGAWAKPRRRALANGLLAVAAVVHSPWVMDAKFQRETGYTVLAERVRAHCSPSGRFVVAGQSNGWAVVHYSGRKGWVVLPRALPDDWERTYAAYRALGAECAAILFDPTRTPEDRRSYEPLLRAYPILEHASGPWFRKGKTSEYFLLDLREPRLATRGDAADRATR